MSSLATAPAASGQTNGIYKALVVSAADPQQRRRITARIPQILGPQTSPWCMPVDITSPVPNPGDFVWVMFEGGDLTKPVYLPANSASFSLPPEEPGTKVLTVASQAERDALAATAGQVVYRSDLDHLQIFNATGTWRDYPKREITQRGSVGVQIAAAASGTFEVTFPVPFTGTPTVVATANANSPTYVAGLGNRTATGVRILAFHRAGTATTASIPVEWIAIGPA